MFAQPVAMAPLFSRPTIEGLFEEAIGSPRA
jgi:hypothetical protein